MASPRCLELYEQRLAFRLFVPILWRQFESTGEGQAGKERNSLCHVNGLQAQASQLVHTAFET
jgi:hypothetical protein